MVTLTAVANPEMGTVSLKLDSTAGVAGILRSDVNGLHPVRLRSGELAGDGGRTVIDYEPALAGPVLYRLTGTAAVTGVQEWADLGGAGLPRFHLPSIPQFTVPAQAVTAYEYERTSRAVFHQVINRADPLVAQARMGTRVGTLTARFDAYDAARAVANVLERGQTLMFRQVENPGQDMYFHSSRFRVLALPEDDAWEVQISFTEIENPPGNVLTRGGWTFDLLARWVKNFDALGTDYLSFNDVTIGEEIPNG